ncbi:thiol:disulfide interchange protein DsbA/DsbL [Thalassotalea piscium]|uniref:Thiol:disulfide interchange protein DsbA n=1 Tax=Thalassotalea piscium TaxID=1230533 RepID=A0A7X0NG17_9GAMM|nr:thiol:disulfide interchange protein DsbA/DsbL [Thalassotalea piscium]MBB6542802.1 thiol:disulfide interchange protein DsbA [Thalassotalea piscium]
MKNTIALFVILMMTLLSGCNENSLENSSEQTIVETIEQVQSSPSKASTAKTYQEGVHYVKVKGLPSEKNEVREYFSFYCSHCFRFEGFIDILKRELPSNVAFEKNHVDFLGGASQKMQHVLTKALIVGKELNKEAEVAEAIFKYIHISRATPTSVNDVRNIFVLMGVDGEEFDSLINSEKVIEQAQVMQANQNALAQTQGITGVPAVIVNGKYRIENAGIDKDNFEQDYLNLVEYLVTLK